jgi:hypothetical protein
MLREKINTSIPVGNGFTVVHLVASYFTDWATPAYKQQKSSIYYLLISVGVGIVQSVSRRTASSMARVRFSVGAKDFSLFHRVQPGSEIRLASYPMGIGGFPPGVERPGREADNSLLSSVEWWSYTSTPPYAFMA